jgi:hypothetical protein
MFDVLAQVEQTLPAMLQDESIWQSLYVDYHPPTVEREATAEETERRLLNGLRKRCPGLPTDLGLKETLASLRRGQGIPVGKKVLIVLDQFEQWLHAKKEDRRRRDLVSREITFSRPAMLCFSRVTGQRDRRNQTSRSVIGSCTTIAPGLSSAGSTRLARRL